MKRMAALAVALSLMTATAWAEQPKAEEYRQMMSSGTYYVEYEKDSVQKCLAVGDGKRMDYTVYRNSVNPFAFINPIAGLFSLLGGNKKEPSALYMDHKYYQFQGGNEAIMMEENQLNDENLDPKQGWSSLPYRLALPEELVVFAPEDAFNSVTHYQVPQFVSSGQTKGAAVVLDYDKYSLPVKRKNGTVLYEKLFYFYYKEGALQEIKTYIKANNSKEQPLGTMKIKKITQEMPASALKIPNGCKIYAAGIGDMNDLLDKKVLIEEYQAKEHG